MTTFFCPKCWKEVEQDDGICPRCGVDIAALVRSRGYVDALIAALGHPEPSTPIRAAWILGRLRAVKAVQPLLRMVESDTDIYQKSAAIEALGRIGDARARPLLRRLAQQGPTPLQGASRTALERLSGATSRREATDEP